MNRSFSGSMPEFNAKGAGMNSGFTLHGSPHSLPTYRIALMMRLCRIGFTFRYVSFQRGMHLDARVSRPIPLGAGTGAGA